MLLLLPCMAPDTDRSDSNVFRGMLNGTDMERTVG